MKIDDQTGALLVKETRQLIEEYLSNGIVGTLGATLAQLNHRSGAFVTLSSAGFGKPILRGCLGVPEPAHTLSLAITIAAIRACHDPRFSPVEPHELDTLLVELSIITPPTRLLQDPRRFPELIKIGRDGLMICRGERQGLVLPQVALEWEWNAEDFLVNTCFKAGLPPDAWLTGADVYVFQADVFSEIEPRGRVRRIL